MRGTLEQVKHEFGVDAFAKSNGIAVKVSPAPAPFSPCCMAGTDDWYFVKDGRTIL